jgi:hypothetical protein
MNNTSKYGCGRFAGTLDCLDSFIRNGGHNKRGALAFQGNAIFSYAENIALVDRIGLKVRLLTRKWSVTTSKHQGYVRRVMAQLPGWTLVEVDSF